MFYWLNETGVNDFSFVYLYRFNYHHHHSGWNPPDTPPESITNVPTSLTNNNNNNHSNGNTGSMGVTNQSNATLGTSNSAIHYRDGQFYEQNCHLDGGSPNGSLASVSPPTIPSVSGIHPTNHLSTLTNYRSHMAYYQA